MTITAGMGTAGMGTAGTVGVGELVVSLSGGVGWLVSSWSTDAVLSADGSMVSTPTLGYYTDNNNNIVIILYIITWCLL